MRSYVMCHGILTGMMLGSTYRMMCTDDKEWAWTAGFASGAFLFATMFGVLLWQISRKRDEIMSRDDRGGAI